MKSYPLKSCALRARAAVLQSLAASAASTIMRALRARAAVHTVRRAMLSTHYKKEKSGPAS